MRLSDMITNLILETMEQENGTAEIQRNEMASRIGCVPSQINYVLRSRFAPEHGFVVESQRGGHGYIRIVQLCLRDPEERVNHLEELVG